MSFKFMFKRYCISAIIFLSLTHGAISTNANVSFIAIVPERFGPSGVANLDSSQVIAAIVMAMSEINSKKNELLGFEYPTITFQMALGIESSVSRNYVRNLLYAYENAFNASNQIQAIIGASTSELSKVAGKLSDWVSTFVPQISYGAVTSALGHKDEYPNFMRTRPSESFQGSALGTFVHETFGWTRVTIFYSGDYYGSDLLQEFEDDNPDITIECRIVFWSGIDDFSDEIERAQSSGSLNRIFVFLMISSDAGRLLEQGYERGLFTEGTQILGTDQLLSPDTWMAMSETADIPRLMKGCISISSTTYYARKQTIFKNFVKRWRAQKSTITKGSHGSTVCDQRKDDVGNQYLYQGLMGSKMVCTGLNFSSYSADGSDISDLALYAYDAVYALANGLQRQSNLTGIDLYNEIISLGNFSGITGTFAFKVGAIGSAQFSLGDREGALQYLVHNFDPAYFNSSMPSSTDPVRNIGVWLVDESEFILCDEDDPKCSDWVFNTGDNSVPVGEAVVVEVQMPEIVRTGLLIGGSICLAMTFFIGLYLLVNAQSRLIRASQPGMLLLILLGAAIASIRVIVATLDITDVTCVAGKWMAHLAFGLVFGALILRIWRVNKLMTSGVRRVTITMSRVQQMLAAGLLLLCAYLLMDTFVGAPHKSYNAIDVNAATINHLIKCENKQPIITYILYFFEAAVLLTGARICWNTKDVPDAVDDSKYIAMSKKDKFRFVCTQPTIPNFYLSFFSSFLDCLCMCNYISHCLLEHRPNAHYDDCDYGHRIYRSYIWFLTNNLWTQIITSHSGGRDG